MTIQKNGDGSTAIVLSRLQSWLAFLFTLGTFFTIVYSASIFVYDARNAVSFIKQQALSAPEKPFLTPEITLPVRLSTLTQELETLEIHLKHLNRHLSYLEERFKELHRQQNKGDLNVF